MNTPNTNLPMLVPISDDPQLIQTVNARDLWQYLESRQDFSTWIKKRIEECNFLEDRDYIRFHKKMEANNATVIEYHVTLDTAKHLAMMERNEKGQQAREYFIESDKRRAALEANPIPAGLPDFRNPVLAAQAWAEAEAARAAAQLECDRSKDALRVERQLSQGKDLRIDQLAPLAEFAEKALDSPDLIETTTIAKKLNMSAIALNQTLKRMGVQYVSGRHWVLNARYEAMGLARIIEVPYPKADGEVGMAQQLKWTELGEKWILENVPPKPFKAPKPPPVPRPKPPRKPDLPGHAQ